jgi:hypothetical protein
MVRVNIRRAARWTAPAVLALSLFTPIPTAFADPAGPPPPPDQPTQPAAQPAAQPASADQAPVADGVPHLSSPTNLPPGTTDDPSAPAQGPRMSYLRELWHAVQTQDVSGGDALLLLTQRPMDANAAPPAGLPPGPQAQGHVPAPDSAPAPAPGPAPADPAPAPGPTPADPAPAPGPTPADPAPAPTP